MQNEYTLAIDDFERKLFWVTDKLNLVSRSDSELGWGNLVLLFVAKGKVQLIHEIALSANNPLSLESQKRFKNLVENWIEFKDGAAAEIEARLQEQVRSSIQNRLQKRLDFRSILEDIGEFDLLREDLDSVHLFLDGYDGDKSETYKAMVKELEDKARSYVNNELVPLFKSKKLYSFVENGNIQYLRKDIFWWRHL